MNPFSPGQTFEGHELLQVLGRGGQATVYLARHPQASALIALKVLQPPAGGYPPDVIGRFRREVSLLTGLESPHITRLLNHGETASGVLWLAYEYIEGFDLHDWLSRDGTLPAETTREILIQLLMGLGAAHRQGIVHRDIKPQNIRVASGPDLHVRLIDFGIAREVEPQGDGVTSLGELIGTPRYMSPEQLRGRPITPASDIYSLGLVALEMLMGPDVLSSNRLLDQIDRAQTQHSYGSHEMKGVDPRLFGIITRMCLADPRRRFQTAAQVLNALTGTPSAVGVTPRSKTPFIAAAVAVVVVAVVVVFALRDEPQAPVIVSQRVDTPSILIEAQPDPPDVAEEPSAEVAPPRVCDREPGLRSIGPRGEWLAYIPPGLDEDEDVPLVVFYNDAFTPEPSTGLEDAGLLPLADREKFVIVAPFDFHLLGHVWVTPDSIEQTLGAITAAESLCVDKRRTYAYGNGNGGLPAELLRCERFAAIAVLRYRRNVAPAPWVLPHTQPCERPVPTLQVTNAKDCRWPAEGGQGCNKALKRETKDYKEQQWRSFHHCSDEEIEAGDRFGAVCKTWEGCEVPLESCTIDGASPFKRSPMERDRPGSTAETSELVWDFLEKHKLPQEALPPEP